MLDIFVCITSEEERDTFTKIVETTIFVENLDMKITKVTGNPYDILEMVKNRKEPAIYFLNVFLRRISMGYSLEQNLGSMTN